MVLRYMIHERYYKIVTIYAKGFRMLYLKGQIEVIVKEVIPLFIP